MRHRRVILAFLMEHNNCIETLMTRGKCFLKTDFEFVFILRIERPRHIEFTDRQMTDLHYAIFHISHFMEEDE